MAHHSEPSVFLCSMLIDAKMSPRMNEAKLMCGRRSAFHLVQYTWGYQDYSRLQRDLVSIMLLPWLDLIIEMVGAFQFSMELLSVLNLSRLSWRYVVAWRVFFLNAWTSNPFFLPWFTWSIKWFSDAILLEGEVISVNDSDKLLYIWSMVI